MGKMLNSLTSMLFGSPEQDGTGSQTTNDAAAVGGSQGSQDVRLSTAEEEMGWLLVDVSRSSSPSLLEAHKEDTSLRRPDGSVFVGDLQLSSASSSDSEDGEADEIDINGILAESSSPCISSPEEFCADENQVDLSSSCSSLSVILESNEEEHDFDRRSSQNYVRTKEPGRLYERLTDSWMIMPPPCFTGTNISSQMISSPFEDQLIECSSTYASYMRRFGLLLELSSYKGIRNAEVGSQTSMTKEKPGRQQGLQLQSKSATCYLDVRPGVPRQAPALRCLTGVTQCCGAVSLEKQARLQQRCQQNAARKFLSRNGLELGNKALMAQSCSRKQMSSRNRLLRPSGGKCGRLCQRAQ